MERSVRPNIMKSVTAALLFTMSTYTYLSFISISYFGQENISPSIFNNIKEEKGFAPILLQCLFLLIFFCNIPFIFFAGKSSVIAIIHQCCFKKKQIAVDEMNEDDFLLADDQPNEGTS